MLIKEIISIYVNKRNQANKIWTPKMILNISEAINVQTIIRELTNK